MKKSYFLFFLSLLGVGPLANADSFYAGFQAGADFFAVKKKIIAELWECFPLLPVLNAPAFTATSKGAGTGGTGGLFLGYAWQFQDTSLGIEVFANGDGSNVKETIQNNNNILNANFTATERLKGFFGVTFKPGYLINEKARLYIKAGWAKGRFTIEGSEAGFLGVSTLSTGPLKSWLGAWQAGIGSEIFISPVLALSLEYNHIQYQKKIFLSDFPLDPFNPFSPCSNLTLRSNVSYKPQSNNVLLGLTYFFTPQETGFIFVSKYDGDYDFQ